MAAETKTPTPTEPTPPPATVPAVAQPPKAPLVVGSRVAAIVPTDVEQIFRLASAIAAAEWAPKSYLVDGRNPQLGYDKNKIVVGIMQGMEVGLTPMAALQSIAVINGMPSLWGDGLLAVVRASGLMVDIKEEVSFDDKGSPDYAVCTVWRVNQATPIQRMFTRAQAQKANLWSKQGPWSNYPQRMLAMRARAWALRDGFADVLRGMRSAEELEDAPRDITPTKPEPQRSDFVAPANAGGYDPDAAATIKPAVTDVVETGQLRTDDDAPPLYEVYDFTGTQVGEYLMKEWVSAYDGQTPKPALKKERTQHFQNNQDSARAIFMNSDCPADVRKALTDRFPELAAADAQLPLGAK